MSWNDPNRYDRDIARAPGTVGGHLSIGRGGFTLHYENARLEGYDCDTVKAAAIRAGLPSHRQPQRAFSHALSRSSRSRDR